VVENAKTPDWIGGGSRTGTLDPRRTVVIGVDAGGTKTAGLCMTLTAEPVASALGTCGNYQAIGVEAARETLAGVLAEMLAETRRHGLTLGAVGFGLCGLDRPKDRTVLEHLITQIARELAEPAIETARVLVNDTFLILRAGTDDGVGVAVVSGTGANTVGRNRAGDEARVGGLASELGDTGGGSDIAIAGLKAARRGLDGRGPRTRIADLVLERLELQSLEDLVDFMIPDGSSGAPRSFAAIASALAPLVFEAAQTGDEVARAILVEMGRELGLCVRLVASRLFRPEEPFPLVFGGSVLARATCTLFRDTIEAEARSAFPNVEVRVLDAPPVIGGVLLAYDLLARRGLLDPETAARCRDPDVRRRFIEAGSSRFPG